MRKRLIFILPFLILVLIACKRDWTCQCEPTENSTAKVTHIAIENKTHSDAVGACNGYDSPEVECNIR